MIRSQKKKLNLGSIGTTKRNGKNLLTQRLVGESARATTTSRRSIKAKKDLDDIIGERKYKIPTKYGVLYINEDTDPKNLDGLNPEDLERNIRANHPTSKEVTRTNNANNRYNRSGVKFKGYKMNDYIEEWQMPVGRNINRHSREPNFVIVTETKASERRGGLGMKYAEKFICEKDDSQMNEFREYPPFDRFKLNRLLAVGRWGIMEGHNADEAANQRGIKTDFTGIKDYEILKHKVDIVRKNRLASWYMEEVYSKDTGILDRLRQMHKDRQKIFREVKSFRERLKRRTRPSNAEDLLSTSSTHSRELPLAPYRSRQTVAELLRTCRDIKDIPERQQLRFGITGLGKFNGESSLIDNLLNGLQDFNDDDAFLIQRDFVVSRPLHETTNATNIRAVEQLFHRNLKFTNESLLALKRQISS